MAAKIFHCAVVTPERVVLDKTASFVAVPAYDGELGVLAHRAPLVARLGSGELRLEGPEGKDSLFVSRGFVQMVGDRLTVLAEEAKPRAELRRADAERELAAAQALQPRDERGVAAKAQALERARALVHLARA